MNSPRFKCCFCSTVCSNINAVEAHLGTDHFNYDPFQCEECKLAGRHAKFPTEFLLKQHCFSEHKLKEFYFRTWVSAEIEEKKAKIADSLKQCRTLPAVLTLPRIQPGLIIPHVPSSSGVFHPLNEAKKFVPPPPSLPPPPPPPPPAEPELEHQRIPVIRQKESSNNASSPKPFNRQTRKSHTRKFMPSKEDLAALLGVDLNHPLIFKIYSTTIKAIRPNTFKNPAECLHFMIDLYKNMNANPMYREEKDIKNEVRRSLRLFKGCSPVYSDAIQDSNTSTLTQSNTQPATSRDNPAKNNLKRPVDITESIVTPRKDSSVDGVSTTHTGTPVLQANTESASKSPSPSIVVSLREKGELVEDDSQSSSSSISIVVITLDDDSDQEDNKPASSVSTESNSKIEAGSSMDVDDKVLRKIRINRRQKAKKTVFPTNEEQAKRFRGI